MKSFVPIVDATDLARALAMASQGNPLTSFPVTALVHLGDGRVRVGRIIEMEMDAQPDCTTMVRFSVQCGEDPKT